MGTVLETLTRELAIAKVRSWPEWLSQQSGQSAIAAAFAEPPTAVVYPTSETELAEVIAWADREGRRTVVTGQGSKLSWGAPAACDVLICTTEINRVIRHAVGDLTVTAEAGARFADVQAKLSQERQCLALDPLYPDQATLGGIVATADAGALRQRYGGVRDMLIGLTFVRADGQSAKAGGQVVKNVAGYDLMKLMTGAYGTLGALSQLTFRTYPLAETSQTLVMGGAPAASAAVLLAFKLSGLTPVAFDLLSPALMAALGLPRHLGLALRFQGIPDAVAEQVARAHQFAADLPGQDFVGEQDSACWQTSADQISRPDERDRLLIKFGLLPNAAVDWFTQIEAVIHPSWAGRIHIGSGLGLLSIDPDAKNDKNLADMLIKLRSQCEARRGFLTLLQAPSEVKARVSVWGTPSGLPLMRQIKQQFDAKNLLGPGRFVT